MTIKLKTYRNFEFVDVFDGPLLSIKKNAAEISNIGIIVSKSSFEILLTKRVPIAEPTNDKKKVKLLFGIGK